MAAEVRLNTFRFDISNGRRHQVEITPEEVATLNRELSRIQEEQTPQNLEGTLLNGGRTLLSLLSRKQTTDGGLPIITEIQYGHRSESKGAVKGPSGENRPIRRSDFPLKNMYMGIYLPEGETRCYIMFASYMRDNLIPSRTNVAEFLQNIFGDNGRKRLVAKSRVGAFFLQEQIRNFVIQGINIIGGEELSTEGVCIKKKTLALALKTPAEPNAVVSFLRALVQRRKLNPDQKVALVTCTQDDPKARAATKAYAWNNEEEIEAIVYQLLNLKMKIEVSDPDNEERAEEEIIAAMNAHFERCRNE